MVTLTATVTVGSSAVTVGQVSFCDASVTYCTDIHLIGTAQLTSAGTAVFRLHPGIGSRSYKAVFAGTPNGTLSTASSTSNPFALTVTGTFPTITAISQSGIAGNYSLTATVTGLVNNSTLPAPLGTVSFLDTSNNNAALASPALGNPVFAPGFANISNTRTGNEPGAIVAGDFTGDGYLDLAVGVNETNQSVSILLGDGTGNFAAVTKSPITAAGSPVLVQDFNGDGIPDLLLSDNLNGSITILLGNGDGTFRLAPGSPFFPLGGVSPIVVADFNGDGILDIAAAGGYYLGIMLGNGDGSFTQMPFTSSTLYEASVWDSMVTGDFNGDGIADLAVKDWTNQSVTIFLGNGDGTFTKKFSVTLSTTSAGSPTTFASGDFNGDGKLDLAVPIYGGSSGSLAILFGNGDGTFYSAPGSPVAVENWPNRVAVGDFNGDGIADILVAAQTSGQTMNILLGKGDGTFNQMPTGSVQLPCCSNAVLGDFNGDGLTDIVSSSFYYSIAPVLLTQLTQTVTATATGIAPVGIGTHQVNANYPGNSAYGSSVSATTGLTATGFALSSTSVIVPPGATTGNTSTITVTPSGAFTGNVALTATVTASPANALDPPTFSFGATNPVSITGAAAGTATLTILTTASTTGSCTASNKTEHGIPWYTGGGAVLACVLFFGIPGRRRGWRTMLGMLALLLALTTGTLACGSGGGSANCAPGPTTPGTTPGNYTITVSGASGTTTATGNVVLTVQ
jgi:hypothetical protein